MKKILIFLMSAAVAVSCSDDIFDVDPSGKVSSETRDEVAKEDPDKVLQGIEASIYTHYATYYKNDLQWLTGFKGFELAFGMTGQDMTLLLQHSMNLYMYINDYWQEEYTPTFNVWNMFYIPIATANEILATATLDASAESETMKAYRARALTSRAFGYYHLINVYQYPYSAANKDLPGVPLATEETLGATIGYARWTVTFGAVPAILNVVLAYLVRAEGAAMHASIGTMSGCFLNILLDPIFILPWGLNMGAEGAGLATFLSNCVACLYFFVLLYVKRGRTYVCVNPKMFSFKRHIVVGVCAVGIPASIQNLLNVTGMSVLNNFTSAFGSNAVAAMGIAQKINSVTVQIALGLSQGIMPLISYNYASGNIKRMKKTFFFTARIALVFLVLMEIAYYAGARTWVGLFMQDQQIVDYGARFLQGFCLGMPFLAIDFLAVGVFQACGLGKNAFLFAILRKVVLEIPALVLLNALFPLYGLAYAQFAAELVLAIAAVIVLARLFRRLERRYQPKG